MITLAKTDEAASLGGVQRFMVGVSWDTNSSGTTKLEGWLRGKLGTDLDLVAIAMQGSEPVRFAGLDSQDPMGNSSVFHSGDNRSGKGSGDDETVTVEFDKVPSPVSSIVFVAAAFKKYSSFKDARNIAFKVYDGSGGSVDQVAEIWPSLTSSHNANAIAKAVRGADGSWTFKVLDISGNIRQGDERSLLMFAKGK